MNTSNILARFKNIKAFVFDIDGVFTNGHLYLLSEKELIRTMHTRDGYALQLLIKLGYEVAIISGSNATTIQTRLAYLGVKDIFLRCADKKQQLSEWANFNHISLENILYMGDDMPDLAAMQITGLPTCPKDAAQEIQEIAAYISPYNGGEGCVRDVIEKTLKLNRKWT